MRFKADVKCNRCRMVTVSFGVLGSLGLVTDFSECCQPAPNKSKPSGCGNVDLVRCMLLRSANYWTAAVTYQECSRADS